MKNNENELTSRIVKKNYGNGKKIMTIVVDYYDENRQRKQKSKGTGITEKEYGRGKKREVDEMRITFAKEIEKEIRGIDPNILHPDRMTVFEFLDYCQNLREKEVSYIHWQNGYEDVKRLKRFF
jgi:hypothetical protein